MSIAYNLIVRNESKQSGTVCLYQSPPPANSPNGMPLAWLTRFSGPGTFVTFEWTVEYSFVWSQLQDLQPGAIFLAAQAMLADPISLNRVTLADAGGFLEFQNPERGGEKGTLEIAQDGSIQPYSAAIGIGMSGSATFAMPAQPNFIAAFTPHPEYWITFGTYSPGEVMDPSQIGSAAPVQFPPGVAAMTATLSIAGNWSVQPA